jgi:hypothetical protein
MTIDVVENNYLKEKHLRTKVELRSCYSTKCFFLNPTFQSLPFSLSTYLETLCCKSYVKK